MKLTTFVNRIKLHTPTGWEFWAGLYRSTYNQEKQISDTMLMTLPKVWPANWRGDCAKEVDFELWFGKLLSINNTATGLEQHPPYHEMEQIQQLHDLAIETVQAISNDAFISLKNEPELVFYDSPDGKYVTRQVWVQVALKIDLWGDGFGFNYAIPTPLNTLPSYIAPEMVVLFNGTLWRGLLEGESSLPAGTPWPVKGYKELIITLDSQMDYNILSNDFQGLSFELILYGIKTQITISDLPPDVICPVLLAYDQIRDEFLKIWLKYDSGETVHIVNSDDWGDAFTYDFEPKPVIQIKQYPPAP